MPRTIHVWNNNIFLCGSCNWLGCRIDGGKMKENKIQNYRDYCNGMHKSIIDKLFFLDFLKEHCEIENFIDFGCADGKLLNYVHMQFPKLGLYGLDQDQTMILKANNRVPSAFFINATVPKIAPQNSVLNLSSVLHEIYSYGSKEYIDSFWREVNSNNYEYIFIRDMMFLGDIDTVVDDKTLDDFLERIIDKPRTLEMFNDYMNNVCHGKITYKDFVHFLMKYRYETNWKRELHENYFSYTQQQLIDALSNYSLIDIHHYTLPFLKEQIKADFNFDLDVPTHFNAIFKAKHRNRKVA